MQPFKKTAIPQMATWGWLQNWVNLHWLHNCHNAQLYSINKQLIFYSWQLGIFLL